MGAMPMGTLIPCSCPAARLCKGAGRAGSRPAAADLSRARCQAPVAMAMLTRCQVQPGHQRQARRGSLVAMQAVKTEALIFDCDGVILLSEELHRQAYNLAFQNYNVRPGGQGEVADWSVEYYDVLQNSVGGGKEKMHHFFGEKGYPSSTLLPSIPSTEEKKKALVDDLQEWKTTKYQDLIASGNVPARPHVNRIHDEARELGLKVGVCSAATKSSAIVVLENLMGAERFKALDVFMAGDDVPKKKPDPIIYVTAAQRMGLDPTHCMCVEDSTTGLKAALGAGMRCVVTYTDSTADQDFHGAEHIMAEFKADTKLADLLKGDSRSDDRPGRQDSST